MQLLAKLQEKKQTPEQQKQAAYAVALYFELLRGPETATGALSDSSLPPQQERIQPTTPMPARGSTSADPRRGSQQSKRSTAVEALRLCSGSTPRSKVDWGLVMTALTRFSANLSGKKYRPQRKGEKGPDRSPPAVDSTGIAGAA